MRSGAAHSAFNTTLNGRDTEGNTVGSSSANENSPRSSRRSRSRNQGKREWTRPYLYGDIHPWARCLYLVTYTRAEGWREDPAKRRKIDTELNASPYLKAQVDTSIKASNARNNARRAQESGSDDSSALIP